MYYMLFKLVRSNVYLTLYNKHVVNVLCEIETIVLSEFFKSSWMENGNTTCAQQIFITTLCMVTNMIFFLEL